MVDNPVGTSIPKQVQNSFTLFNYSCYKRYIHPYKDIWHPTVEVYSLICQPQEKFKYEKNTVTIVFDDFFLKLLGMSIFIGVNQHPTPSGFVTPNICVRGKEVNSAAAFGLEIPSGDIFGDVRPAY